MENTTKNQAKLAMTMILKPSFLLRTRKPGATSTHALGELD